MYHFNMSVNNEQLKNIFIVVVMILCEGDLGSGPNVGESPQRVCTQKTLVGESQKPHGTRETNTSCRQCLSEKFY